MVENGLALDDEQFRYDQEDDMLIRLMHENNMRRRAEEQEQIDISVKCEIAKYRSQLRKIRHMYHNAARVTAMLSGSAGVAIGVCLYAGNTLGVLVATVCTCGLINLTAIFDKKSRRRKEGHHGL